MKKIYILPIVIILFACSSKDNENKSSAVQDKSVSSNSKVSKDSKNYIGKKKNSKPVYITHNGKWTNLVYNTDHDKFFLKDKRSLEELTQETKNHPNNPDAWFALGKKYWNAYNEVSNAAACFKKAFELAPDSVSLRVMLAEIPATQLDVANAAKAYDDAYKYAKTDKEKAFWSENLNYYAFVYKARGLDPSWAIDLLKKHAENNPRAYKNLSYKMLEAGRKDEAIKYTLLGLKSSTNDDVKIAFLSRYASFNNYGRNDKNFKIKFDELVENSNLSPYSKAILKLRTMDYRTREDKLPRICLEAFNYATNLQQRFDALNSLGFYYVENAQPEKVKEVMGKILKGEKPTAKMIRSFLYWLKSIGDTNTALELISSEENEDDIISHSLAIATFGKDINVDAINKLIEKFPSNGEMYAKIADIYKNYEWYDNEIKYREEALKHLTRDKEKTAQISKLINCYLKFDELEKAEKLLNEYVNVLSNSADYSLNLSRVYLVKGRTNDAFELLMSNCGKMSHEIDNEKIIKKLLTFNWPERSQHLRAANLAEKEVEKMSLDLRHERRESIFRLLIKSYIYLKEPDKALNTCKKLFAQSGKVEEFPAVCNLVNDPEKIKNFINEILYSGNTQTHFFASAAGACERAMLPELALQLYRKAWETSMSSWRRLDYAGNVVRLADELKDFTLRDNMIDEIIQKYKNNELPYWSIWRISRIMQKRKLNKKLEELLKLVIEKSTGDKQRYAIYQLIENYRTTNNKQGVKELINEHFLGKELDIDSSEMLINLYRSLGESNKVKPLVENIERRMTNSVIISRYGEDLINILCSSEENEKAMRLAEKWLKNPDISFNAKISMLYPLSWRGGSDKVIKLVEELYAKLPETYQKENVTSLLLDMYNTNGKIDKFKNLAQKIINSPNVSRYQIENIAQDFANNGMNAEALTAYDRILDKLDENSPDRFNIINRQANIYLKMGDAESAIECAKQSVAAKPDDPSARSLLANAYRAAGQYKKALDEYCKGMESAGNSYWEKVCCDQIAELVQTTDVKFDSKALADSILSESRTVQSLMTAANLYSAGESINKAEDLIKEALGQTTIDSQKLRIYNQWLTMVEKSSDEKLLDKTLHDYYKIADDKTKVRLARKITELSMKNGDYEKVVKEGSEMLKNISPSVYELWQINQIQNSIAQAYLELGDKENAWKTINQSVDFGKQSVFGDVDWNSYMNFARQLGKTDEAVNTLEKFYKEGTERQKNNVLTLLFDVYKEAGREDDMKKIVTDIDKILDTVDNGRKCKFAEIYKKAGENEKAMNILKNVSRNGNKWEKEFAINKLYEFYKDNNQLDEALEWAEKQPESPDLSAMIAEIYREKGEYDKSVKLYEKLVNKEGINVWRKNKYMQQLMKAAAKTDDKEKIVKKIVKNIKKENKGNIRNELNKTADIYRTAEMYDEALRQIKKLKKITKNKSQLRKINDRQAECLAKTGEYDDAVKVYEEVLKDDSLRWEEKLAYQNKIAKTYKDAHRSDEAKETAEDIVRTCKEFLREHECGGRAMNARFALADAYFNSGDREAARETLEKIQKKYKNTSYAKKAEKKLKEMK